MKLSCNYAFTIELFDDGGKALGRAPVEPDWEPAVECARFGAMRSGEISPDTTALEAHVAPRWSSKSGPPYAEGFRVEVTTDGPSPAACDFSTAYFGSLASAASGQLVADGKLQVGETFRYLIAAYAHEGADDAAPDDGCNPTPLRLLEGSLDERLPGAEAIGTVDADDPVVIVPRSVLDEASALARDAGARETGGILVGDLYRDRGGDLFAVVEALIPATKARGELTSLTLGPETWAEVHSIIALRGRDETMLGWLHSHPAYLWNCKNCPIERRRRCPLAADFFSDQDRTLHRDVFPRAYSVALVVNLLSADEHTYSMFGWRGGLLVPRGFHVRATVPSPRTAVPAGRQEECPDHA